MTRAACDRFEQEAVLRLEQGLPLDEHFAACPDCLTARALYNRLRAGLAGLGEGDEPRAGWQARVRERIEARRAVRRRSWWWLLPPVTLVAAAAAALLFIRLPQEPPSLQVLVEAGATVRRGTEAQPGDLLRLTATTGKARQAELRVYRNDTELILVCATESPCVRHGDELTAEVRLDGVGRYQSVLLLSEGSLPPPASTLDADAGAALAAGATVELGTEVIVR